MDDSSNNGIMTKVWGPAGWLFLHSITMSYPTNIDKNNSEHISRMNSTKDFFILLGDVLPCKYCRDSYKKFITSYPIDNFLDSRRNLAKWLYDIHNLVNDKLGVPPCEIPSFENFYNKYESYRASCHKTTKDQRLKNLEKGCVHSKYGVPKKCVINIIDIDDNYNDISNIREFNNTLDLKYLSKLSKPTLEYMYSMSKICKRKGIGNQNIVNKVLEYNFK